MSSASGEIQPGHPKRGDLFGGAPTRRRDVVVAIGWACVVMVVAVVWRTPVVPTDPWYYVQSTLEFPSADWVPLGFTRYGIILATIPPALLFGNAEATYYFWPLVSAGLMAAMLYLVGRRLFGPVAGGVAVILTVGYPIVFVHLTRGYPDVMSVALLLSAVFCALAARDRGLRGRASIGWLLATGFLLGWGFEVRETALFAWPLVLAILWRRGSLLRTYAVVAAPVLLWAALDIGLSGLFYGDPLLKAHTLMGTNPTGVGRAPLPSPVQVDEADRTRWGYLLTIPKSALQRSDGTWLVVSGALAALAVLVPDRRVRLVSAGLVTVVGLNLLAGGVLLPDRPLGTLNNPRYWIQYFPLIALVLAGLVSVVSRWVVARSAITSVAGQAAVGLLVAVVVCFVPAWHTVRYTTGTSAFAPNGGGALEELRRHLADSGFAVDEVWTDRHTARLVPVYQRPVLGGDKLWTGTARNLLGEGEPGPGDAVLLYSARSGVCDHCHRSITPWLAQHPVLPETWELVFEDSEGVVQLYLVH